MSFSSMPGPYGVPAVPPPWQRGAFLLRLALFLTATGIVAVGAGVFAVYAYYAPTIPAFEAIEDYQPKLGTRIYAADNQLIGEFAIERRVAVPQARIPPLLYRAFMAA